MTLKIETDEYKIASLPSTAQAVDVIREAESKLAELSGSPITLIAYAKDEEQKG